MRRSDKGRTIDRPVERLRIRVYIIEVLYTTTAAAAAARSRRRKSETRKEEEKKD